MKFLAALSIVFSLLGMNAFACHHGGGIDTCQTRWVTEKEAAIEQNDRALATISQTLASGALALICRSDFADSSVAEVLNKFIGQIKIMAINGKGDCVAAQKL